MSTKEDPGPSQDPDNWPASQVVDEVYAVPDGPVDYNHARAHDLEIGALYAHGKWPPILIMDEHHYRHLDAGYDDEHLIKTRADWPEWIKVANADGTPTRDPIKAQEELVVVTEKLHDTTELANDRQRAILELGAQLTVAENRVKQLEATLLNFTIDHYGIAT